MTSQSRDVLNQSYPAILPAPEPKHGSGGFNAGRNQLHQFF